MNERGQVVGMAGLGAMGGAMASNLLRAGHELIVHDLDAARMAGSKTKERKVLPLLKFARIVVTMVETTSQTEQVIFGMGGAHQRLTTCRYRHLHEHERPSFREVDGWKAR